LQESNKNHILIMLIFANKVFFLSQFIILAFSINIIIYNFLIIQIYLKVE